MTGAGVSQLDSIFKPHNLKREESRRGVEPQSVCLLISLVTYRRGRPAHQKGGGGGGGGGDLRVSLQQ